MLSSIAFDVSVRERLCVFDLWLIVEQMAAAKAVKYPAPSDDDIVHAFRLCQPLDIVALQERQEASIIATTCFNMNAFVAADTILCMFGNSFIYESAFQCAKGLTRQV